MTASWTNTSRSPGGAGRRPSPDMITVCAALGLMLLCGVVYAPVLTAGFVSQDDGQYIAPIVRLGRIDWSDVRPLFNHITVPAGTGGYYQPLTLLSLLLDARLTSDPQAPAFQFHLTNLLLHLANVGLLFWLFRRLTGRLVAPILLALLFGLHPVQVESVAWVSQRMTLLAAFFSILALHCYLRYAAAGRIIWLAAVTILYLAAVLSKPTFLGLPVFLLILDVWPLRRRSWRPAIEKIPLLVIMCACAAVQLWVQEHVTTEAAPQTEAITLIAESFSSFFVRIVWPVALAPFYPAAHAHDANALLWELVAVLVAVTVVPVWAFWRQRPIFAALAGTLVIVCPALLNASFTSDLLGDQYLYAALIPPLAVVAVWLKERGPLRPALARWSTIAAAAVLMACGVESYGRTFTWQSSTDLFREVIHKHPNWARGFTGLVEAFLQENDLDAALRYARKAADLEPHDPTTQFYLGTTLLLHQDGRVAEAIGPLRKALTSNPNWIACLQNLGVALARSGRLDKAIGYLEQARDLQPDSAGIRVGLGHAYLKVHRPASARRELEEALRHRNDSVIHMGLAIAWAENDAPEIARRHLAVAIAKDPRMAARAFEAPELRDLLPDAGPAKPIDGRDGRQLPNGPMWDELPAARNARGS